jgi:predicted metal-dependent phosphoesterase TrpH
VSGLTALMLKRGVAFFSITDHDALDAYPEAVDRSSGATVVTGIEINSTYKDNEVHVLGYALDRASEPLRALIERNRRSRRTRVEQMVAQLRAAGYPVAVDAVLAEAADGASLGRPHVAKALVRIGAVSDVKAAFRQLLSRGGAGYVPSLHVTPQEAIGAIAAAGGVPVLAHPGRLRDEAIVDELAGAGLAGLEVYHPSHSAAQRERYKKKAGEYGLLITAGSDFHDPQYNPDGVGVEVERTQIEPFLLRVS